MSTTPTELTFEEAVAYVQREKAAAYALIPQMKGDRFFGGAVYVLYYEPDHEEEPDEYDPYYLAYASEDLSHFAEEGSYSPDEISENIAEALDLIYRPAAAFEAYWTDYELPVLAAMLEGVSRDDAVDTDYDAFWNHLRSSSKR